MTTCLITIDGVSGTKKTYFIKKIYKKLGKSEAFYLEEFPSKGIGYRILELLKEKSKHDTAFRTGNPEMELFTFLFLKAYQHKKVANENLVIEDRGLPSIIGYYLIQTNHKKKLRSFIELYTYFEKFLIKPRKTIILTGDFNNIPKRLDKRDRKTYSTDEIRIEKQFNSLLVKVARQRKDWYVINVDRLTERQIIDKMLGIILD